MELKQIQRNKLRQDLDELVIVYLIRYKNAEPLLINYIRNGNFKNEYEMLMFMIKTYQGAIKGKMTWQKYLRSKKYEFDDPETATVFY
jgi:hypothetical protein